MEAGSPQSIGPFREMHQEVHRLFHELILQPWGGRGGSQVIGWHPRVDVGETDETIVVEVELPGVQRRDVQVEVEGDTLRITGERHTSMHAAGQSPERAFRIDSQS
jgi:HSP20 family protein